jgi:hypothetical protein
LWRAGREQHFSIDSRLALSLIGRPRHVFGFTRLMTRWLGNADISVLIPMLDAISNLAAPGMNTQGSANLYAHVIHLLKEKCHYLPNHSITWPCEAFLERHTYHDDPNETN